MGANLMKYALIIPDGAADRPIERLENRTVLQAAEIPNLDRLARSGRVGTVQTVPAGLTPGSDVAIMSVLGYDPQANYTGRAPIEAAAMGIDIQSRQIVFRCNLVTITDGVMEDFSAGHIRTDEARELIAAINDGLGASGVQFHPGVSYRHVMVTAPADDFEGLETTPPHDIIGQEVKGHLPEGEGAEWVKELMALSVPLLAGHPVNKARMDRGEKPASSIWLWGQGQKPTLKPFRSVYGPTGAVITAVDLVRGLGTLIGFEVINVPGATGYIDTNYDGKAQAACEALDRVDMVVVHVEAPDEAGHNADLEAKKFAIEQIDQRIIGPVAKKIESLGDGRIMVLPDHPTPIAVRSHTAEPVPFVIAGTNVSGPACPAFDEDHARATGLHVTPGWKLMKNFLSE